uniref:hypothetical protein n=1 Tax=Enterocloster clostridioformis TaxID=1531 RepID=UPI0026F06FBA|nr:hypothetical protein [Enterocloster clostridioformis]
MGISAAVIGTIMLLTRLLDGVTDLGMGAGPSVQCACFPGQQRKDPWCRRNAESS